MVFCFLLIRFRNTHLHDRCGRCAPDVLASSTTGDSGRSCRFSHTPLGTSSRSSARSTIGSTGGRSPGTECPLEDLHSPSPVHTLELHTLPAPVPSSSPSSSAPLLWMSHGRHTHRYPYTTSICSLHHHCNIHVLLILVRRP